MDRLPALQPPLRRIFFLLLFLIAPITVAGKDTVEDRCSASSSSAKKTIRNYRHIVVLVHGYMGSDREQKYLGDALIEQSKKSIQSFNSLNDKDGDSCQHRHPHQFVVLNSKANVNDSTDGVAKGGQRLAAELSDWIQQHTDEMQVSNSDSDSTITTLSLIGNSLGGLYSRYALAELYYKQQGVFNRILPLLFCTTSSPHLGTSQETFITLPKWFEPYVSMAMRQQTMDDLFGINNSTIVMDMCHSHSGKSDRSDSSDDSENEENEIKDRDYLYPLQKFQKRIAIANAYNTDFLVSVSSAAFLSSDSESVHHHRHPDAAVTATDSTRLMKDIEHVALQVTTASTAERMTKITPTGNDGDDDAADGNTRSRSNCANSLDRLGWHKIFLDSRNILPDWLRLSTPEFVPQLSYTSKDLQEQFKRYGTLLPIAHPLNMANSRTDRYQQITKSGQPIMDALAELLVLDMMEISDKIHV